MEALRRIRSLRDIQMHAGEPGEMIVREAHGYIMCKRGAATDLDAIIKHDGVPIAEGTDVKSSAPNREEQRATRSSS